MRFVNLYFVGYIILVMGIALALWRSGILHSVAPAWIRRRSAAMAGRRTASISDRRSGSRLAGIDRKSVV